MCFLCVIYVYFRVPEPTGRTFAELDMLFEQGVSARKFATTKVNVFEDAGDLHILETYQSRVARGPASDKVDPEKSEKGPYA